MNRSIKRLLAVFFIFGSFLAGGWYFQKGETANEDSGKRRVLYYIDPMNPVHTSKDPGLAPCGMMMEPVFAEDGSTPGNSKVSMHPGAVTVSSDKQQMIGVTTAEVEKSAITYNLRTIGKVAVDENRVRRLVAATEGWITEIFGATTGSLVEKDQVLANFYSREALNASRGFFFALQAQDRSLPEQAAENQLTLDSDRTRVAEDGLILLGMSRTQIAELKRTRQAVATIEMRAPVAGLVLARNVEPGVRLDRFADLFRIADISRVWVLADVFDNEMPYLKHGTKAEISLPRKPGRFQAQVSQVLPQFDTASRTLKVRLAVDNPDFDLRPDMLVDVKFEALLPPAVNVPVDAILDGGENKRVFVDLGNGTFEPRQVETGWRTGNRVEILDGLEPGERIVLSGNFLLDSESRMRVAAAGVTGKLARCPQCSMYVSEKRAKKEELQTEHGGHTYFFFCSDQCRKEFDTAQTTLAAQSGKEARSAMVQASEMGSPTAMSEEEAGLKPQEGSKKIGINQQRQRGGFPTAVKNRPEPMIEPGHPAQLSGTDHPALASPMSEEAYGEEEGMSVDSVEANHPHVAGGSEAQDVEAHFCAVCRMPVEASKANPLGAQTEYQGKTYSFCSKMCKAQFARDPERYRRSAGKTSGDTVLSTSPQGPAHSGANHD